MAERGDGNSKSKSKETSDCDIPHFLRNGNMVVRMRAEGPGGLVGDALIEIPPESRTFKEYVEWAALNDRRICVREDFRLNPGNAWTAEGIDHAMDVMLGPRAIAAKAEGGDLVLTLTDGRVLRLPFEKVSERLARANAEERAKVELVGSLGLQWEGIGEDLDVFELVRAFGESFAKGE